MNLAAVANSNPFDSNVSSTSGDVWAQSVDPTATYSPLSLAPGQSGTSTVTFTAGGRQRRPQRGFLAVDTFNPATASGDELTLIPYTYKVR